MKEKVLKTIEVHARSALADGIITPSELLAFISNIIFLFLGKR